MSSKKKAENYLDFVFEKNTLYEWNMDENGIVTILFENKGIFNTIAQKLLHKPRISQIHMEEMGSFIWPLIDGKASVYDIGQKVSEHFGEKANPLYERLSVYMKQLENCNFIKRV